MGRGPDNNYLYYHEKLLGEADIVITSSLKLDRAIPLEAAGHIACSQCGEGGGFCGEFYRAAPRFAV